MIDSILGAKPCRVKAEAFKQADHGRLSIDGGFITLAGAGQDAGHRYTRPHAAGGSILEIDEVFTLLHERRGVAAVAVNPKMVATCRFAYDQHDHQWLFAAGLYFCAIFTDVFTRG